MAAKVILLVQLKAEQEQKRYQDFGSLEKCWDHVLKTFEDKLKTGLQEKDTFTYDLNDLYSFLDDLNSISCLIYSEETRSYMPHDKTWIKSKLYLHLTNQISEVPFDS